MTVRFLNSLDAETRVRGKIVFEDAPETCETSKIWGKKGKVYLIPDESGKIAKAWIGAGRRENFSNSVLRDVAAPGAPGLQAGGACVMMGVMKAAAELKLSIEVNGIAGLVENMPDGGAYRPDDIIRAMNGKTIEVLNTDAEGRLTLADVLTLASKLEPDAIIDVATLTGTAKAALEELHRGPFV